MKIYICSIEGLNDAASFDAASLKICPQRREKLNKIKGDTDRRRSVCAGLLLNHAVAAYKADCSAQEFKVQELSIQKLLDTATQSYEYRQVDNGKPYIADLSDFYFSLSHSGKYVLCAWDVVALGADLQCMDREVKDSLAKRAMTEKEYIAYLMLPLQEQEKEFYRLWTIKESYCKLTGKGLSQDFRKIETEKLNYHAKLWKGTYWLAVSQYE